MSSERNYKAFILELRPRLQSVNAFVTLIDDDRLVKIILHNDSIQIIKGDTSSIISCNDMNIVTNSLASLKHKGNCITFRFITNCDVFDYSGTFKTEFLQNTVASIESLSNKPLLSKGTSYVLQCRNCNKSLSSALKFQRILPLPSDNQDPSDWFCHAHSSEDNISINLDPKEADIFYTHCYVHLNRVNVKNIKGNDKIFVCKFCLWWLGMFHKENTLKVWFNTVNFVDSNTIISTESLTDIFHSMKDVLKHSLYNSLKVILSCQVSPMQVASVLIWVLEKKLQILFQGSGIGRKYDVAKVLFRFVNDKDEVCSKWKNDFMANIIYISKPMILDLLKHLHKFNKMLPREFSKSNDFLVSYLFMYEPFIE